MDQTRKANNRRQEGKPNQKKRQSSLETQHGQECHTAEITLAFGSLPIPPTPPHPHPIHASKHNTDTSAKRKQQQKTKHLITDARTHMCTHTSPSIILRRVDLPAPLAPTKATRVSRSIPKSRSLYSRGYNEVHTVPTPTSTMTNNVNKTVPLCTSQLQQLLSQMKSKELLVVKKKPPNNQVLCPSNSTHLPFVALPSLLAQSSTATKHHSHTVQHALRCYRCKYLVVSVAERNILHHDHRRGNLAAVREGEDKQLVGRHLLGEACINHFAKGLLFALRLSCKLSAAVTKSCDVILEMQWGEGDRREIEEENREEAEDKHEQQGETTKQEAIKHSKQT